MNPITAIDLLGASSSTVATSGGSDQTSTVWSYRSILGTGIRYPYADFSATGYSFPSQSPERPRLPRPYRHRVTGSLLMDRSLLDEVATHGGPAQAALARQLLDRTQGFDTALPESLESEIDLLVDAYLNDPYLTRNDVDRDSPGP